MQNLIFLTLFLACQLGPRLAAQDITEDLSSSSLETKEDYKKLEPALIASAQWLETTPLDTEMDKRLRLNGGVLRYISGSPRIKIELKGSFMDIIGENAALLPVYLASYGRSVLESNGSATTPVSVRAGLSSAMIVYKRGVGMKKNKTMEKLLKMSDAELEAYIAKNLI